MNAFIMFQPKPLEPPSRRNYSNEETPQEDLKGAKAPHRKTKKLS